MGRVYLKLYFPHWRGLQVYQEILGEDNLTKELPPVGRFLPFLAVSYQGAFYLPRLTAYGRTDLRFEYAILEPNYSVHGDSLYWTYEGQLMGDPLGPNASEVDLQVGRWLDLRTKLSADAFYTEQAPNYDTNASYPAGFYPYPLGKEHSGGLAIDFLRLPRPIQQLDDSLATLRAPRRRRVRAEPQLPVARRLRALPADVFGDLHAGMAKLDIQMRSWR